MKRTISAMVGHGSVNHNSRKFHAKNTDPERSHLNVTYCQENIKAVYHELFDEALERYNAKQTRADRRIENYYEKIRSGKQEKPFHEIILQVGNKDDMSADSNEGRLAAVVLDEYMKAFQERNPNLRVFSAHLHMDEATPHLHIDFVPFTTGSKRGLDTRVSLKQALAAQGFKGGTRGDTEWSQWVRSEKEQLSNLMERHGIEWEDKGTHDKHLSVLDYKKGQRAKEIAALETVKAEKESQVESQERRLKELAPAVKDMERLAADFSTDPEEILPEAGTLESAKSYREKKAKPLLAKIVKVLRSLFRKYIDLKGKFDRLQGDYDRVREGNARLSDRLMEVKMENKKLRQISADYTRVKRVFGPEQVQAAVEADKQREQAEKGRKRPRRSLDRGGR
ncbi:plasmid recombination protein [Gordonibacter faecis]|uniref:Plasmid recombination protein n=2 Tax=Gordonibacter TaxID=644652 RepID=A0ABT7DPW3_9ACTN|nr:plasmid recombination protein [Gordonibacter sp. KGMB12511]MDJ1650551.1 plasmid recombination protein [Gordonibacter sp. KGMB12511]